MPSLATPYFLKLKDCHVRSEVTSLSLLTQLGSLISYFVSAAGFSFLFYFPFHGPTPNNLVLFYLHTDMFHSLMFLMWSLKAFKGRVSVLQMNVSQALASLGTGFL